MSLKFEAGSDAVLTNSFGRSRIKLASFWLENDCYRLNREAVCLAADVCPEGRYVGKIIWPTGLFFSLEGQATEEEFEASFAEQIRGVQDGGVDLFLIETQYDIREALCALRAAKRLSESPVFVTMTLTVTHKGFFTSIGNSLRESLQCFGASGADAVGANCFMDSSDMVGVVKAMRHATPLPPDSPGHCGKA